MIDHLALCHNVRYCCDVTFYVRVFARGYGFDCYDCACASGTRRAYGADDLGRSSQGRHLRFAASACCVYSFGIPSLVLPSTPLTLDLAPQPISSGLFELVSIELGRGS